jgi:hypothetical protein
MVSAQFSEAGTTKHRIMTFTSTLGEFNVDQIANGNSSSSGYQRTDHFAARGRVTNSFCSITRQQHSQHRRRTASAYSKSAIQRSKQLAGVTEQILHHRLMPRLVLASQNDQPVDILRLAYALSLDFVNCFIFGMRAGSNFLGDQAATNEFLENYEARYPNAAFWLQELPWLTKACGQLGISPFGKQYHEGRAWLQAWTMRMCATSDAVLEDMKRGFEVAPCDVPVVYEMVRNAVEADCPNLNPMTKRRLVASELFDQLCELPYTT